MLGRTVVHKSVDTRAHPLLWGIVIFNGALEALSAFVWFSGDAGHTGVADRLFGHLTLSGFRADFVWLMITTALLVGAFTNFVLKAKYEPSAKKNALLCAVGIMEFGIFVCRALLSGNLDFG